MSKNRQDFPFASCLIQADQFPALAIIEALENSRTINCNLLDLKQFVSQLNKLGAEKFVSRYLSNNEQGYLKRLTSRKRKNEWLGGRFAARLTAAELLSRSGDEVDWPRLSIEYDKRGRPFLAIENKAINLPDISISHSADMVAVMAVKAGLCGIDIQQITDRVTRIRERFCSASEEKILMPIFGESYGQQITALTGLWAAKESLRKVGKDSILPGFLELELSEINTDLTYGNAGAWEFIIIRKGDRNNAMKQEKKYEVILCSSANYVLALTTTNATLTQNKG